MKDKRLRVFFTSQISTLKCAVVVKKKFNIEGVVDVILVDFAEGQFIQCITSLSANEKAAKRAKRQFVFSRCGSYALNHSYRICSRDSC